MDDLYLHADSDYIIHVHSYVKLGWLAGWMDIEFVCLSQPTTRLVLELIGQPVLNWCMFSVFQLNV